MKQRHRLHPLAAALLASLLLAMPASASWGYSEETSTQTGDYVNSDDAEAQRQQEIAEANAKKAQREQKAAYQQQINDRQNDLDKLKAEQKELQSKLAGVSGQKKQAQAVKASLDADLDDVLGQISTLNLQIEAMNESIKMTEEDIAASKQNINEQISLLRKRILTSYKAGYSDALSVVLGADSYYDSLVRTRVITEIADRDKDIITELSAEKEELEEKETQLKDEQEKLEQANEALEENKSSLSKKISAASAQNRVTSAFWKSSIRATLLPASRRQRRWNRKLQQLMLRLQTFPLRQTVSMSAVR